MIYSAEKYYEEVQQLEKYSCVLWRYEKTVPLQIQPALRSLGTHLFRFCKNVLSLIPVLTWPESGDENKDDN